MPVTLGELLQPQVIVDTISKVSVGKGSLSQLLGFDLGSSKIKKVPTRYASFRIFNQVRQPAAFTAPGTGPSVVPPNPVGTQQVGMARLHEKIILDAEQLGNLSRIDGPNAQIDSMGQDYIGRQVEFMAQKVNMSVETMTASFLRGALYLQANGSRYEPYMSTPSGNYLTVDFGLPAGNKSQLNMLGAGNIISLSWANPAAPIIADLSNVRSAMVQLTGMPLANVICNSLFFHTYVIKNTDVRTIGGAVQAPMDAFQYMDSKAEGGFPLAGMAQKVKLKAIPWIDWYLVDDVVSIGGSDPVYSTGTGTLTKVVPDDGAFLLPPIDGTWCQMWHGGELVAEDYGKPMQLKMGLSAWRRFDIEPTTVNLLTLLNFLCVPYRERAWAYPTLTGF